MSISFHCERCKKMIKAPDDAGGKYGKCPHCKHKCYVPMPHDDSEPELKLEPIDAGEEARYANMMRQTYNLRQNILHERAKDDESEDIPTEQMSEKELIKNIVVYLQLMANGELERAEQTAARLKHQSWQAREILKRMTRTERPEPELENIPPRLLMGLIKNLAASL